MKKSWTCIVLFFGLMAVKDCSCNDQLGSATGELDLSLCDRGTACGCEDLDIVDAKVDFGGPEVGSTAYRAVRLTNSNQPRFIEIRSIELDDPSGAFAVVGLERRASDAADAQVESLDPTALPVKLAGTEEGTLYLSYTPSAAGENSATLRITSNSDKHGLWQVQLLGGGGASRVCPDDTCDAGAELDFGTFNDDDLGPDFDQVKPVVVHNDGQREVFVAVELTDDGVPETLPGELVGQFGIFSIEGMGCTVLGPGESLSVLVHYRPFTAGEHEGELTVRGFGEPVRVPLRGRVVGSHICFRTEDDNPDDAMLQFGDAPTYQTAANVTETRKIWVRNCGYQENLTIGSVTVAPGTSSDFASTALPWTQTTPLPPPDAGGTPVEIEVPVALTPTVAMGTPLAGRLLFNSNDMLRPVAAVDLRAFIGAPEVCLLSFSQNPIDFGWVATDEASQGCIPGPGCPGIAGDLKLSRQIEVRLVNAGQRACTNIALTHVELPNGATHGFTYNDTNGINYTLAPGQTSGPITILFVTDPTAAEANYLGKLYYQSAELAESWVLMKAKAGGSPNCEIKFQPVSAASFFCQDESLAFGNVNIGQSKTINLKLINTGSEDCQVSNIAPTSTTSIDYSFPTTPLTIPVNSSTILPVTYSPSAPLGSMPSMNLCGENGIQMVVNSGPGGANESKELLLYGNPTYPDIDVIPGEIDFGDVTVGCCSAEQRVAIYNSGGAILTINSVSVLSSSDPTFEITQQPDDFELAPGENTEMLVRFCAQSEGAASGVVEIQAADDNDEYYAIAVSGNGTLSNEGDDSFHQPERPKVDVLWVVDDSGSMQDEQTNLANNFAAFINSTSTLDTDYHIGVTTTDVQSEWSGKLYACTGNPLFITDQQPQSQQISQFQCNVKVSQSGRPGSDAKESALQAGRMALDYPDLTGYNAGFYRDDAKLYLIMVTDERDQSDGTAQLYVDYFSNLKGIGNPDLLNISAISGPPPDGCPTAEANQKGYDAVTAVGGEFRSICTADWSNLVASLGLDVFNARRQFPLSRPATPATITVQVCPDNGSGQPDTGACTTVPQDPTNGWTFDGSVNSITFNGSSVPGPGQHVVVQYTAVCYQ